MRAFAVGIIALVIVLFALHATSHNKANQARIATTACSATAPPCIKITQADGTVYKLNDFRFVSPAVDARHCILFISLPDEAHRETCGKYLLKWIGPSQPARRMINV